MVSNPHQLLNALQAKAEKLMHYCDLLKDENSKLKQQLDEDHTLISLLQNELDTMNTKYKNLKTAQGLTVGNIDAEDAKKRFDKLVREIDKCISLLNQ